MSFLFFVRSFSLSCSFSPPLSFHALSPRFLSSLSSLSLFSLFVFVSSLSFSPSLSLNHLSVPLFLSRLSFLSPIYLSPHSVSPPPPLSLSSLSLSSLSLCLPFSPFKTRTRHAFQNTGPTTSPVIKSTSGFCAIRMSLVMVELTSCPGSPAMPTRSGNAALGIVNEPK